MKVSLNDSSYNPEKILCVGVNYRDHAKETNTPEPSEPVIFAKMPSAIIAPGDAIVKPNQTQKLDYEAELVVVIGKKAHEVKPENVKDYIAGFMVGMKQYFYNFCKATMLQQEIGKRENLVDSGW